jgi:cell wall-associated NlpC family hydrolase
LASEYTLQMTMRFPAQCALFLCCLLGIQSAVAQHATARSAKGYGTPREESARAESTLPQSPRPLTLDEGLAILGAALDSRHQAKFKIDCSHFVHGLYERAGFHYSYAPSADLYAGIDEFERVTIPQPGDLAVWRGHSGIVINPAQHTFFSLMHSGAGVDSYDSAYWRKKGHPRFFRYVRAAPSDDFSDSRWTASR